MSYQVLARKWRPQRFDDVIGQEPVTRTLRNALSSGRLAHAFVFAGPRGAGKTTTARILAKALNCIKGPTAEPCGVCDACQEIAQGRDIDVMEIDAASHTGIDNIREVVIAGLSIAPVRDRYKIFIIDEVHQLSQQSFNALLKSIEEPPSHVIFMMATTELHKIPDTIQSRSQVFEFRTIAVRAIVKQLRMIATAEGLEVPDSALTLVARAAEGSMRDSQSALDQVMAFAGQTITVDDVATVLGLVGRDLLFELIEAVVSEDGPRAFVAADRAVEGGHDLRLVCRELSTVVRDMMVLSVDPGRADESGLAEEEIAKLSELSRQFSREDLMRAFDLLAKAETDIRNASQPRYYFEMALLRWMHQRKLVPLSELMEQMGSAGGARLSAPASVPAAARPTISRPTAPSAGPSTPAPSHSRTVAPSTAAPSHSRTPAPSPSGDTVGPGQLKDAFLAEVRAGKAFFYNTVVAQAQRIEVAVDTITFAFLPNHRALREQFDTARAWLETTAERVAGRKVTVTAVQAAAPANEPVAAPAAPEKPSAARDLRAEALSSSAVQAMLEVFPAEISDVEEM
ncbi:MAG: DNA polymerase III subunit gamma/tau [Acidobacteria bacterium]|nr:DNA polymerase III subunit gamma/tau [Acidobacteriota bacterium]